MALATNTMPSCDTCDRWHFAGRPLKGFVYVSPSAFRTAQALRTWLAFGERAAEETAVQRY